MAYQRPHKYTPEELREALLADLRSDLAFSEANDPDTDQWIAYRATLTADIANLDAGGRDARLEN